MTCQIPGSRQSVASRNLISNNVPHAQSPKALRSMQVGGSLKRRSALLSGALLLIRSRKGLLPVVLLESQPLTHP